MLPFSHEHVRAVTHLDVTIEDCQAAAGILCQFAESISGS